jgi:hypothetical protein
LEAYPPLSCILAGKNEPYEGDVQGVESVNDEGVNMEERAAGEEASRKAEEWFQEMLRISA